MKCEVVLYAKYVGCEWEEIDSFDSEEEAMRMLAEYKMAYGAGFEWRVVKR